LGGYAGKAEFGKLGTAGACLPGTGGGFLKKKHINYTKNNSFHL